MPDFRRQFRALYGRHNLSDINCCFIYKYCRHIKKTSFISFPFMSTVKVTVGWLVARFSMCAATVGRDAVTYTCLHSRHGWCDKRNSSPCRLWKDTLVTWNVTWFLVTCPWNADGIYMTFKKKFNKRKFRNENKQYARLSEYRMCGKV